MNICFEGAPNRRPLLFGGIKMKNVDCSPYSSSGKYIMDPSKEWASITHLLTQDQIEQIRKVVAAQEDFCAGTNFHF